MRLARGFLGLMALVTLGACSEARIVEDTTSAVTVRYDGLEANLKDATATAEAACRSHGKTARLRRTEAVAFSERFAHFDCV